MKHKSEDLAVQILDLEVVEFTDLEQLEEAIAPIFLLGTDAGGKCSGGAGSGCQCIVPT